MSTHLMTYLNYMSTWDTETDDKINQVIDEHNLFIGLGDFDSDDAVNSEFDTLVDLATTLRNETIAADATQIAADAAAVASIWSFGLGMAAFVALEAAEAIEKKVISSKSTELNKKLSTVDTDISSKINKNVHLYIVQYKANNKLIAGKMTQGLDTRTCRSLLMQFMAEVDRKTQKLDAATFRQYAASARVAFDSPEISKVYDALDELNFSNKSDADIQKCLGTLKGLDFDTTTLSVVRGISIAIMAYKLKVANNVIEENAKAAGLEVSEVESSAFGMLDAVGKFVTVVAVVMSVVDAVLDMLDIVDVVKQTSKMCDALNGDIKTSYKNYFNGIKEASKKYNAAITKKL